MKSRSYLASVACVLLMLPLLSACGGDSKPNVPAVVPVTGSGTTTVRVAWPAPEASGRLIPLASQSIRVRIYNSANVLVAERLLVRPEAQWWLTPTMVTITGLPADTVRVVAEALPTRDGAGTVQAQGTTHTKIVPGDNDTLRLRLDSAVATLSTSPVLVDIGTDTPINITARNADGEIILESPEVYTAPVSDNPSVAIPVSNLGVRGYTVGKAVFTLFNKEANKSISVEIQTRRTAEYSIVALPSDSSKGSGVGCSIKGMNNGGAIITTCGSSTGDVYKSDGFVLKPNPASEVQPFIATKLAAPAGVNVDPADINDQGYICGTIQYPSNTAQASVWTPDAQTLTELGKLGADYYHSNASSITNGLPDSFTVVGSTLWRDSVTRIGDITAFYYKNGKMLPVEAGAPSSMAWHINEKGIIAGLRTFRTTPPSSQDSSNLVTWRNGVPAKYTRFENIGTISSINSHGQMVGHTSDAGYNAASPLFWTSPSSQPTIGTFPSSWGDNVRAAAINDNGFVIGTAYSSPTRQVTPRAVCWRGKNPEELVSLLPPKSGWELRTADALNNKGYIAGVGRRNGFNQLYVLIPQDNRGALQVGVD